MQELLDHLGLGHWGARFPAPVHAAAIVLVAYLVVGVARRFVRRTIKLTAARARDSEAQRRLDTLSRVVSYLVSVAVFVSAAMLVLGEFGISLTPLLATAGVAGVVVGFGAQSLVKDYFTGVVLLLENQMRVGDVVVVADREGKVEEVTLRYVRLRDYHGNVHFVPNGEIKTVTNRSIGFSYAVVDVNVAYKEDIDAVFDVLRAVGADLRADPRFAALVLDDLEVAGVEQLGDSSMVIRCRLKTEDLEQWLVRRELLRRIKRAFDAHGIEIAIPHRMIVMKPQAASETTATE